MNTNDVDSKSICCFWLLLLNHVKCHLINNKQSYILKTKQTLRQFRAYEPGMCMRMCMYSVHKHTCAYRRINVTATVTSCWKFEHYCNVAREPTSWRVKIFNFQKYRSIFPFDLLKIFLIMQLKFLNCIVAPIFEFLSFGLIQYSADTFVYQCFMVILLIIAKKYRNENFSEIDDLLIAVIHNNQ